MSETTASRAWRVGDLAAITSGAGIGRGTVINILTGRVRASADMAERIEYAASMRGIDISRLDVLYPEDSTNPLVLHYRKDSDG